MRLAVRASERHFLDHLAPIWNALQPHEAAQLDYAGDLKHHAATLNLQPATGEPPDATLVASWGDLKRARTQTPVIYMEHGAGQTYTGVNSGSYLGATDRDGVTAVLVPGPLALARHKATQPTIRGYAVGCPKLDQWHRNPPTPEPELIAATWHWDCHIAPETRSAYQHHRQALKRLGKHHPFIGHTHPRGDRRMMRLCEQHGYEYTHQLSELFDRARILIADNTSAIYEFASLGRPVVVLNAPWYRRNIEHGLRFWSHIPGIQADEPHQLLDAVTLALTNDKHWTERRQEIVAQVYATTNGDATQRALDAIREATH